MQFEKTGSGTGERGSSTQKAVPRGGIESRGGGGGESRVVGVGDGSSSGLEYGGVDNAL